MNRPFSAFPSAELAITGTTSPSPTPTPTPIPTPTAPTPTPTPTPTAAPTSTVGPTTPPPTAGCTASFQVSSSWPGGFVGAVRVTAGATPVSSWRVTVTLPSGAVAQAWGAQVSVTSPITLTPAGWNASLPAGGVTELGFTGTGSGAGGTVTCTAS
ncbi:cellulose binding domain-containing protein [Cellulomonas fulva]|uniref:cellulose binding domain-containing protein n=1 Tax=Cellulomonas fulva TaxID=2835530 RepID=UPI0027DB0938|nr:cellulose binding domain-containing protein [Cellulomonas fulva]